MASTGYDILFNSIKQALDALLNGPSQYKWLADAQRYVQQSRELVGLAGVRPGDTVYDIGCGPGYVLWICRERLGCVVEGCDPLRGGPIYKELYEALHLGQCITAHASTIEQPLPPTSTRFDVIFATWITWIGFGNWSEAEFSRYIGGLMTYLRPHGRILLRFEESRFQEGTYESQLLALGKKVAPFCYLLRKPDPG